MISLKQQQTLLKYTFRYQDSMLATGRRASKLLFFCYTSLVIYLLSLESFRMRLASSSNSSFWGFNYFLMLPLH